MQGRRILLGVGGGIAAYKACELARLLVKAGAQVRCDLDAHRVQIEPAKASAAQFASAIQEAGFTPTPLQP